MKKGLLLGFMVGAVAAMSALADQIKIEPGFGPSQTGQGGEFTALPIGFRLEGYIPGVTGDLVEKGTFQTFCLELHESVGSGLYDAALRQVTRNSGITLNKGTAWLYDQFKSGHLEGYLYGAGRATTAGALQHEIWYLMGQVGTPDATFDPIVNAAALLEGWNVTDTSAGWLNVGVLNVWALGQIDTRIGARQDFLVESLPCACPDGGVTLALLGMGLTGLGVVSRGLRKPFQF